MIRAPLGCASFFFGATVVFVFLLPASFGRMVAPSLEADFRARHYGSIHFGEFQLAWLTRQHGNVQLRDPDDRYVGQVDLELPPLIDFITSRASNLDPIQVELRAEFAEDVDGVSNLARALRLRPDPPPPEAKRFKVSGPDGQPFDLTYELEPSRISWTNDELESTGRRLEIQLEEGRLRSPPDAPDALAVKGRLVGATNTTIELSVATDDFWEHLEDPTVPASYEWDVGEVSTATLAAVLRVDLPYEEVFGETINSLSVDVGADGGDGRPVSIDARSDRAQRLTLAGLLDGGVVSSTPPGEDGVEGEPTGVSFKLTDFWIERVIATLLPFLGEVSPVDAEGLAHMELADFRLPLDGRLEELQAEITLELGEIDYVVLPSRAGAVDWSGYVSEDAGPQPPIRLRLSNGMVFFPDRMSFGVGGHRVHVQGTYDFVNDHLNLEVKIPLALTGLALPSPLAPGAEAQPNLEFLVQGPAEAPSFRTVLAPEEGEGN